MPDLAVRRLTKIYPRSGGGVRDVDLDVADGELFGVVGPSGAGKTTLLRLIAGLERPDAGSIHVDGRDLSREPPHRRGVAYLTQRPALYPHRSVAENLALGVRLRQSAGAWRRWWRGEPPPVSPAELRRRVADTAERLGLSQLLDRRPGELSGGEQQRVALGRAVIARSRLWLLDEPLASLDPVRRLEIRRQLHLLRGPSAATIIEVSHDPVEARTWKRLAVVADGRIVQAGFTAEVYARPATVAAARSLGWPPINLVDAAVVGWADPPWHGLLLGVRPEAVFARPLPGGRSLGRWLWVDQYPLGPAWVVTAQRPGATWAYWADRPVTIGQHGELWVDPAVVHGFDPETGSARPCP